MQILLAACNAKYIHSNLALYSLRAYAGALRPHILLREYTINQPREEILRDIYRSGAQVVCFSCYIWNISFVKGLMGDLAKILPGILLWAGGPEVSFDAEAFLTDTPAAAGVMVGEGEATFRELLRYYVEGRGSLEEIRGIVYREGETLRRTGQREVLDLDTLPFPYEEDLDGLAHRILYYESSRGCPFSCSYCLSSVEHRLRFRSLELVKKELQFFLERRVPQVKFVDRTFNCRRSHAEEIWRYLAEHDNGVTNFHFEISADLLTEEELSLIKEMRPGLIQLEIGVQTVNPLTIAAIRRTMDLKALADNVRRIRRFGNVHQHLDLIAGLPYEDLDSFRVSFNWVYALRPQQLQLGFLKVLKGSYMMEAAADYRLVWQTGEPYEVLSTRWLGYGEILRLKMVESMVEVYYNSGQFLYTLQMLEAYFADAFGMYEALGAFYERKGYAVLSHARIRRYEILLEFAREYPGIDPDELTERMLYDLYLRENLKSRPSFAPSQKPYERAIWEYRRRERIPKTSHIEVFRGGRAVLFDYTGRDPLTNNARTKEVKLEWECLIQKNAES